MASHLAHNQKTLGSNPGPATILILDKFCLFGLNLDFISV